MRTIEWQVNDSAFEEENQFEIGTAVIDKEKMNEEGCNEDCQLKKYKDPFQDAQRQDILTVIETFGVLFAAGEFERIAENLLTEDFEAFTFDSKEKILSQHYIGSRGFIELCTRNKIQLREVKVTNVDSEKSAAWQTCEYRMIYESENDSVTQLVCEVFTVRDKKICKYKACFGSPNSISEFEQFLAPSRKEKMLAKVKEINYALAGQPDFEKIASLLNESTEYKIWRWEDHKCFTFSKFNLPLSFEQLQENMCIRSVVPYELSVDSQQKFISGTYIYHLEEKFSGNKFIWLSTCIYSFDHEVSLVKISQQGELYPEGEVEIPFESHSRESLVKAILGMTEAFDNGFDAFYNDTILYDCRFYSIMPQEVVNPGYYLGMKHIEKLELLMASSEDMKLDSLNVIDFYVDQQSEIHDVVLMMAKPELKITECQDIKKETYIYFTICNMENGKLAKEIEWSLKLPVHVPLSLDMK